MPDDSRSTSRLAAQVPQQRVDLHEQGVICDQQEALHSPAIEQNLDGDLPWAYQRIEEGAVVEWQDANGFVAQTIECQS